MPSDSETEASELTSINADLNQLASHVSTWLNDRFLSSETASEMNLEDIAGLILWLQQWHLHFNGYDESATTLADAGLSALADRLAQIRQEIDKSIANFTEMAANFIEVPPASEAPPSD